MSFTTFSFHPQVAAGVQAAGYTTPTPIQTQAIPPVMQGRDVMGLAQTGTGKTAAFALPILHRLSQGNRSQVRALVIAPTRELAEQINDNFLTLGRQTRLRSLTVYGGVGIHPQISKLKQGVEIVVACPGRLLDHLDQGTIDLSHLEVLVLDEADQMFDMGFFPAIRRILKQLPTKRQTLLFSATMPAEIRHLAQDILRDPVTVQVGSVAPAATVSHALYPVAQHLKTPLLLELLRHTDTESVLVFTRTKHRAKRLGEQLGKAGYRAASLQGNLSQNKRQAALDGFRDGSFQILVATDIAARGIDVSQVSHVVNYDIPDTPEAYIHRIGRTGRAARSGDAFTLVTDEDVAMIRAIERTLGKAVERRTVAAFDYAVAAPAKDQEFARPPRQAMPRRPAKPAARNRSGDAAKLSGSEQKRQKSDGAGHGEAAPLATSRRRRRSRNGRAQAQTGGN
ncbi:DEAD/DEAH box helicase [Geoalkalibacter sp.]|uniref:DEAD/DEAH box helicase n=1 Tax=Geoalkalibacter sp. TaxID=3041440 RepID=UPI00272E3C30|nr:DEAD/DEAH box helicase [Geoalkalibacter sp.]